MSLELLKKYLKDEPSSEVAEETVEGDQTTLMGAITEVKEKFLTTQKGFSRKGAKEVVAKEIAQYVKANEVMHPTNTNYGAELMNNEITVSNIVDLMNDNKEFAFLSALQPGFRSAAELSNAKNGKIPVLGNYGFMRGRNTWTTGQYPSITPGAQKTPETDLVTIQQDVLYYNCGIDYKLAVHSVTDIMSRLQRESSSIFAQSIADIIINADSNPAATGNINSDDQAFIASSVDGALDRRFIYNGSIRDTVIAGGAGQFSPLGTLTVADFMGLMSLMDSSVLPSDMIAIMDTGSYYKLMVEVQAMGQDNLLSQNVITQGALKNFNGVDIFATNLIRKAKPNGKIDTLTPANNTDGTILLVKRNAVQHGFASELESLVQRGSLQQGYMFELAGTFGFGLVDNMAGRQNFVVGGTVTL